MAKAEPNRLKCMSVHSGKDWDMQEDILRMKVQ
jgi:hypothetical protein